MSGVAIVHDYLTQRGGAERVVLAMAEAFPHAPIYTSLYEPDATYRAFADLDIRTSPLNRSRFLRRNHRAALPLLAGAFENLKVEANVVLASSSGWAHGVNAPGAHKVVYCYTPARWLYLPEQYGDSALRRAAMLLLRRRLLRWDRAAARSAEHYLAISTVVRERVREAYGIDADILHPPHQFDTAGPQREVEGIDGGFFLVVSRLLAYKNVGMVVQAMSRLPGKRLVVVGAGPMRSQLEQSAPANVTFVGSVSDDELRWLYGQCHAVVSAAHEDFGLVPLEGAAFGKPAVTLAGGGFLDTITPGETGLFFDAVQPDLVADAMKRSLDHHWDPDVLTAHAADFAKGVFIDRLRSAVSVLGYSPGR